MRNPFLSSARPAFVATCGLTLLLGLIAVGCGSSSNATQAAVKPANPIDPAVAAQERATLMQTLGSMTPDQRAAYLREHPGDVDKLRPQPAPAAP